LETTTSLKGNIGHDSLTSALKGVDSGQISYQAAAQNNVIGAFRDTSRDKQMSETNKAKRNYISHRRARGAINETGKMKRDLISTLA
jgi:hypothetical protein